MTANILKYRSVDLMILYCCVYFGLLSIIEVVVWNSIELIRTTEFSSQVDLHQKRIERV